MTTLRASTSNTLENPSLTLDRRTLLKGLGAVGAELAFSSAGFADGVHDRAGKPLRGLFPIALSPFTQDNKLDLDCLAAEVTFCNRAQVPGLIWPQLASGWSNLSTAERFAGAEAMLATGKQGNTALVIGVQTKGYDTPGAVAFAKHAARNGADGICSLPPEGVGRAEVLKYYQAVGRATDLPLFVQTTGNEPVDLVVELFQTVPTMRVVKDEAGDPVARVTELRRRTEDKLAVFAGKGCVQMMDEMRLGFTGFCPKLYLADVFQQAWELYEANKPREAFDMFGRVLAFSSINHANQYVMVARGIFKESTRSRPKPGMGQSEEAEVPLTETDKKVVRDALDTYLKPYLRA